MPTIKKLILSLTLAGIPMTSHAVNTDFGGWQYAGNGQITGVISSRGIATPFPKNAYDSTGVAISGGAISGVTSLQNTQHVFCTGFADEVAINAAIVLQNFLNGGVVWVHSPLLNGICDIAGSVNMLSNVVLRGDGIAVTTLKLHAHTPYGNNANVIAAIAPSGANLSNFQITDMTIDGNQVNQPSMLYARAVASTPVSLPYIVTAANNTLSYQVDGAATLSTATIAQATYTTLYALVTAVNSAVNAASSGAYALQFGGALALLSSNGTASGSIAGLGGNGAAGLFGTPSYLGGTADNAYNGIVVRGNPNQLTTANNFVISNVEVKNAGYHGIAVYDGATQFRISEINAHHNNFRCIHVHAAAVGNSQPTTKYAISRNRCHDDGQGIMLPTTAGSGMFVVFDGDQDVSVQDNMIWNEPDHAFDIVSAGDGITNLTRHIIAANNQIAFSGNGLYVAASSIAPIQLVTLNSNAVHDISYPFLLGSAPAALVVTPGINDTLTVNLGGVTQNIVIPGATYASAAALASAIQSVINTAYANSGSQVSVGAPAAPAGALYMTPQFSNGQINNAFAVSAAVSHSAYAALFGSAPVQYGGTRTAAGSGNCLSVLGVGAFNFSDIVASGNRLSNCAGWGMQISGASPSSVGSRNAITGNVVDLAGLDNSINTGGVELANLNGGAFTGNTITNSNTAAAAGRQLYLLAATNTAVTGNYIDTVAPSGAYTALDLQNGANYNVITGNTLNRNNGSGNQFNNTGTGNIIANNILGLSGAGVFIGPTVGGVLSGITGSIGGSALAAGACASGTAAVTNAATTMAVDVAPTTYPGDGNTYAGYVSASGTVTVKVCSIAGGTPVAGTYNVRVLQ